MYEKTSAQPVRSERESYSTHLPDPAVTRDVVRSVGEDGQKFPQCNVQSNGICVLGSERGGHHGQNAVDGLSRG